MKAIRVTILTLTLLVGATPRSVPQADNTETRAQAKISRNTAGDCYLVNGIWYCEP